MGEGLLFIVSAPSGAGKTSLVKALLERDAELSLSVSCTTRQARAGEQDGIHYHFLSQDQFRQELAEGAFLEHAEVFGNFYGTREADVRACIAAGRDLVLEIDWQGARQVRERFGAAISIFVLPPSIQALEQRLRGRGTDSDDIIAGRMAQARDEMLHFGEYDYLVVNDRFEMALDVLAAIVTAERQRLSHQRPRLASLLGEIESNH
ncbi:guanylate kinase [Thiorhodococcus mannitoliphagus]|uniref:Guanylate kinase n=1 Tax=Thiorhodococcus mannitoliphagus TaxID=329406 RepID=A0A6P1DKT1_9GAMM|nr:guanylate kinase [Thiorhodococcus mannitoliphagus]NEX18837.1 guanylate kinase [Thiorhodococcus mannitoliphagus]